MNPVIVLNTDRSTVIEGETTYTIDISVAGQKQVIVVPKMGYNEFLSNMLLAAQVIEHIERRR